MSMKVVRSAVEDVQVAIAFGKFRSNDTVNGIFNFGSYECFTVFHP